MSECFDERWSHLPGHLHGLCRHCGKAYKFNVEHHGKDSAAAAGPVEKHHFATQPPVGPLRVGPAWPPSVDEALEQGHVCNINTVPDCCYPPPVECAPRVQEFIEKVIGACGITEVHYKPEDFAAVYPLDQLKHEAEQALAQWADVASLPGKWRTSASKRAGDYTGQVGANAMRSCAGDLEWVTKGKG